MHSWSCLRLHEQAWAVITLGLVTHYPTAPTARLPRHIAVSSPLTMPTQAAATAEFIEQSNRFGANNYSPLEVVLCRGDGPFVWDVDGKRYFDMLAAYSAVNQGHGHPKILAALIEQAKTLALTSRAFHNDKMGAMLEKIATVTGFERVLPMNTGAEAVETALKAMRRWGYEVKGIAKDQAEIIVVADNFHGRTITIVGFSTDPDAREGYGPTTPGFKVVPYGDAAGLEAAITPNTCGVLIEPIQGEAGVIVPPADYLPAIRAACTKHNVIMCLDEIQTGLGRTGKMFAWQHTNTKPDMITLGKALSGGVYPVSCMATSAAIMNVFTPGSHGSTYGGNPLAAAVAVAALEVLEDEKLPERAAELGEHALARLKAEVTSKNLKEVRGTGLMLAVEYNEGIAKPVCKALKDKGVLAKDTHATTIRFAPPLVISKDQLNEALDIIIGVLNTF